MKPFPGPRHAPLPACFLPIGKAEDAAGGFGICLEVQEWDVSLTSQISTQTPQTLDVFSPLLVFMLRRLPHHPSLPLTLKTHFNPPFLQFAKSGCWNSG